MEGKIDDLKIAVKKTRSVKSKPAIPIWITTYFSEALDSHEKIMQVARLASNGIAMHKGRVGAIRVLAKIDDSTESEETKKRLAEAETDAALAESEINAGFPVLYSLITIALWSWLENLIKGFLELWVLNHKPAMKHIARKKFKIAIGEYLPLSRNEKAQYIIDRMESETASSMKKGINRFNSLLKEFELSISLNDADEKNIYELQSVRNIVAHRGGKVDKQFMKMCPWIKTKMNKNIQVDRQMLSNYSNSTGSILVELLYAIGDEFDKNLRPSVEDF